MEMLPSISIIIPVYNNVSLLDTCVNSVVNQTLRNIEIILIDDGSVDESSKLCDEWTERDNRITVIHKENAGVSAARNDGIRIAKGRFLIMLDSDDSLDLNTCKFLLDLQSINNADCIIFGLKQKSGNVWAPNKEVNYNTLSDFRLDFIYWLKTELLSSSVNKLYKRELIKELYPNGISFGEDLIFSLCYLQNCERISFIPSPLYLHNNLNMKSISHTFLVDRIYDIECWQEHVLNFVDENIKFNPRLYDKYVKDVLFYIKGLYAYKGLPFKEKTVLLDKWRSKSYWDRVPVSYNNGITDCILSVCLKQSWWFLPQLLFSMKKVLKQCIKK